MSSIVLLPRQPIAAVLHIVLVIDEKTSLVRRSVIVDSLGNRTEYGFSEVQLGAKIDSKKFDFKIPKGVSVLRQGE